MVTLLKLTIKLIVHLGPLASTSASALSVEAFCVCKPMKELTGPELRRWHDRVVVGILLAGSAAFALVFWVTIWAPWR
jgi:hypothetical protein